MKSHIPQVTTFCEFSLKANREEILMQLMIKGKQQKISKGILIVFVQVVSKYNQRLL